MSTFDLRNLPAMEGRPRLMVLYALTADRRATARTYKHSCLLTGTVYRVAVWLCHRGLLLSSLFLTPFTGNIEIKYTPERLTVNRPNDVHEDITDTLVTGDRVIHEHSLVSSIPREALPSLEAVLEILPKTRSYSEHEAFPTHLCPVVDRVQKT